MANTTKLGTDPFPRRELNNKGVESVTGPIKTAYEIYSSDATQNAFLLLDKVGGLAGQAAKPFTPWIKWYNKGYAAALKGIDAAGYSEGNKALLGVLDLIDLGVLSECEDIDTLLSGAAVPRSMARAKNKLRVDPARPLRK